VKARKHAATMQSKLDGAFAQYHNEVQDMQAKSDELVRKNKSLRNKNCCGYSRSYRSQTMKEN
jgi:FtsZ-binding cell division protein ZapB